jgi:hypothetical protein
MRESLSGNWGQRSYHEIAARLWFETSDDRGSKSLSKIENRITLLTGNFHTTATITLSLLALEVKTHHVK